VDSAQLVGGNSLEVGQKEGCLLPVQAGNLGIKAGATNRNSVVAAFLKGAGTSLMGKFLCWLPLSKEPAPHWKVSSWE
jgi:hypothetical protein